MRSRLTKLRLERFKNFLDASLHLGEATIIVGSNASGKSNLIDALRFLHGVSRGYNLAEIIGEKWIDAGTGQGIRGGMREITFCGASTFALTVEIGIPEPEVTVNYRIEVRVGSGKIPRVMAESITIESEPLFVAESVVKNGETRLLVNVKDPVSTAANWQFKPDAPILPQLALHCQHYAIQDTLKTFSSIRCLDLRPEVMRQPSFPGQRILGDRGENLSSVVQSLGERGKVTLLDWLDKFTPMKPIDFEFIGDVQGKICLHILEANGQTTSAYSLSLSTLRLLGILAELLGDNPAQLYCFDPLEMEIHPTRLHLLVAMIEGVAKSQNIQILGTTHSSQLLRLLSPETTEDVSLIYRLEARSDAGIVRILDLADARRAIEESHLGSLHESAWLENVAEFVLDDES